MCAVSDLRIQRNIQCFIIFQGVNFVNLKKLRYNFKTKRFSADITMLE